MRARSTKFDAYQLAKYDRDGAVRIRDVLFLVHAKPKDADQEKVWKQLVDGELASPDTWEVSLSAGKDKRETFERLIAENKLGGLALLRNLRLMQKAEVPRRPLRRPSRRCGPTASFPTASSRRRAMRRISSPSSNPRC